MRFTWLLIMSLSFVTQTAQAAYPKKEVLKSVRHLRSDLMRDGVPQQTDAAIRSMIDLALFLLHQKGHETVALAIGNQFYGKWDGYFTHSMMYDDIGDHRPYSEWLALTYDLLKVTLGEKILKFWHLDDINTVNYAITVVFDPKNPEWDRAEYARHFTPFSGVLAYWSVWIGCEVYTMTAGASFPCSPAGTLGRLIMVHLFEPYISNQVYDHYNKT